MKSIFSALTQNAAISSTALTIRAQTVSPNDNGKLRWSTYLPRVDVNSINLSEVLLPDARPAADRRAWNAPGRRIPRELPAFKNLEIAPVEAEDVIDEYLMQKLFERLEGNLALIINRLQHDIPGTTLRLAESVYRRLELDAFSALANGMITVRNPQDATKTYTVPYGFDSARYQTAPTPLNDVSVNAWDYFQGWLGTAVDQTGGIQGVLIRQATYNVIRADAPLLITGERRTGTQLAEDISDEIRMPFEFVIMEDTVQEFIDGGTEKVSVKTLPAEKVIAIPTGGTIGTTAFAPVVRAMDIARVAPAAQIDTNGVAVYYVEENDGKTLKTQAQANALPTPDGNKVAVLDAGV